MKLREFVLFIYFFFSLLVGLRCININQEKLGENPTASSRYKIQKITVGIHC